ncbi:transmembrane protein 232 isoform 1-T2 [Anomaloglossus baeobatrachus]|uniref:transmembrane protein 232 n=1 Tax=Anomaloglossus baeobatrachus TaxID=238106 RepID=UPI003F507CF9
MPIVKIPVIQKFGIISAKHHNELKKKLLEKTEEHVEKTCKRKPLEVTEEFIKQFNAAEEVEDQERMLDTARKILHRCKRQTGFHLKGSGRCGSLQHAWTELILMVQCTGKIEEEALDILILSIDQAELNPDHITVLFFIAESILYRICCDAAQKPYLLISEVKLAKLGFLTFLRLYTFHLLGHLQHYEEQRSKLSIYIKALPVCKTTYQSYPNVLSSIHIMLKVGEIMCDLGSSQETNNFLQEQPNLKDKLSLDSRTAETDTFLWHALLIWQHTQNNSTNLHDVSKHLLLVKEHLHQENGLDLLLALFILGDAAKIDISCLRAFVEIGSDFLSTISQFQGQHSTVSTSSWPVDIISVYTVVLADICLHGATAEIQKRAFIGFQSENTWNVEITEACLHGLLCFVPPNIPDSKQLQWLVHYCTVYNLVILCHELQWDDMRDSLRNAICESLDVWKNEQSDTQVLDAEKVAEAEVNGPTNPFISASAKIAAPESPAFFQHVGYRLASALSQQFLPPVVSYVPTPRKPFQRQVPRKVPDTREHSVKKKSSRLSLRQELGVSSITPPLHFFTRTSMELQKVVEDQWSKELGIRFKEEEEEMKKEEQEKQKIEEEKFNEIMRKREQKLRKTSKPYELP